MSNLDAVKKVMMYQKDKSGFVKEPTVKEMADLVVLVLSQVKVIEQAIKEGRLDGKTPIKDVDYISKDSAIKMLTKAVNDALSNEEDKFISRVEGKFDSKVYQSEKKRDDVVAGAIDRINTKLSEVKDGVVTEAEIRRAANLALGMIELPDFSELIKDSLDGETVRDVLSRLTGDKRYKVEISDVNGLAQAIAQVSQIRGQGGTIGKQQVYNFIRQAIADGTISGSGMGDMTVAVYDPANKAEQVLTTGDIGVSVASQSHNHTGVYAPVLGADDNYVTDAEKAALHAAVTVSDSAEIDLTITGQQISASIVAGSIDETKLDTSVNASLDLADAALPASSYDDATSAETNTGTSTAKYVSPDGLAGSYAGTKTVSIQVTDGTTDVATGDGKAYLTIPEALNGMNLVRAQATVVTAGTTNATTVMIHNKTDAQDMLSGAISIASAGTVGTVGTVNTSFDDVATNDVLRIDVDSVSTTAPKGLICVLEFRLP